MRKSPAPLILAAALMTSLAVVGCKKNEEAPAPVAAPPVATTPTPMPEPTPAPAAVTVVSVDTGNAVGPDNKVTSAMTTFGAKDTLYASITTDGAANNATLATKWTFQDGQVVHEESKSLNTTGPATTEFHISKPDGWPVGKYKLEVMLDGATVQTREIEVK